MVLHPVGTSISRFYDLHGNEAIQADLLHSSADGMGLYAVKYAAQHHRQDRDSFERESAAFDRAARLLTRSAYFGSADTDRNVLRRAIEAKSAMVEALAPLFAQPSDASQPSPMPVGAEKHMTATRELCRALRDDEHMEESRNLARLRASLTRAAWSIPAAALLVFIVAGVMTWRTSRPLKDSLTSLAVSSSMIAAGSLDVPVESVRSKDVRPLAEALESMRTRLLKAHDAQQAEAEERARAAAATAEMNRQLQRRDIENQESQEKLRWLATHDVLTGLPNRALIDDRLRAILAQARRRNGQAAVLFFDLDDFKQVNDSLGHERGDELLVEMGRRCATIVRESDAFGRTGGDEFVVIAADVEGPAETSTLARRLLRQIEKPFRLGDEEVYRTGSIGIAMFPGDGLECTELLQHADLAMYRAKALGGNRSEFFSENLQREIRHRVEIESGLRKALLEDRLFLEFQPQVDLKTGRIVGVESLVRWRTEDGGVLMPDQFIPVIERTGLSITMGDWVLRAALADARRLREAGHDLCMAVNFSARQFGELDMTRVVERALGEAGVAPNRFEVEITESAIVSDLDSAARKAKELRDMGVPVALDDFGTGYASMNYVQHFLPSRLKIDRGFVEALPEDRSARSIVLATIALAKGIGAEVIAEGPETDEQVLFLQDNGCNLAQGFRFSRPVGFEKLAELLAGPPFELPRRTGSRRIRKSLRPPG